MRWTHLIPLITLILSGLLAPRSALAQTWPQPRLESNQQGLTLTWDIPAYNLALVQAGDSQYSQLRIPGLVPVGPPGHPELPLYSGLVGLPPTGAAQLHVVDITREVVQLPAPPLPAPVPRPIPAADFDPHQPPLSAPTALIPDAALYSADTFYPQAVAELGPARQLRRQRFSRLTIYPLRVKPASNQVEVLHHIRLEITFEEPASGNLSGLQSETAPFDRAMASTLLNPEAGRWQTDSSPSHAAQVIGPMANDNRLKITVDQAGLYALNYTDLATAGVPLGSLDPATLQLSHGWPRQQIPLTIEGEADGRFDSGDRLLFYAQPEFSRYEDNDTYFLEYGNTTGLRIPTRSASPGDRAEGLARRTILAEENHLYDSHYQGRDGDYWYWADLHQPDSNSGTYPIHLDSDPLPGSQATLTVWLQGYTDPGPNPDHRVTVAVNGNLIGEETWNGDQAIEASLAFSTNILQPGQNQVTLSLPGLDSLRVEGTWLDALSLTYPTQQGGATPLIFSGQSTPRAYTVAGWSTPNLGLYDITDPLNPHQLAGFELAQNGSTYTLRWGDTGAVPARYLVVPHSQIMTPVSIAPAHAFTPPAGGADYIIITHPDFATDIAPLAQHRAAQGLRVVTVDVEAIYDAFGPGRLDPAAIQTFLQQAYTTWPAPAPTYVLLVGDGTYDFKNHSGYNAQNFIPPYMAHVDPWWGETAADNQYVSWEEENALPEMLIGRLAVNSPAEAATVVDKIIRYEAQPSPGDWNSRHLFVADNEEPNYNLYFFSDANAGYNQVQAPFTGQRFYYSPDSGGQSSYLYTSPDTLRTEFLQQFNRGAAFITFHGHSSWLQWAAEGLLRHHWEPDPAINDLLSLRNHYRLPVILEMTCFTAFFHRPEYGTLDESLLRLAGGGAVATWGSTGLGVSTGHTSLQAGFYQAITSPGADKELGAAILAGKMALFNTGSSQELLDTFTLLGDPALKMNLTINTYSDFIYLPLVRR